MKSVTSRRRAAVQRAQQVIRFDTACGNSCIRGLCLCYATEWREVEVAKKQVATDSDGLDAGSFKYAEHIAYACDVTRITHILCGITISRAEADIVSPLLYCLARVLKRRTRDPYDHVWREEIARNAQGHIALSEMNARSARRERDIYAVIDKDGYAIL